MKGVGTSSFAKKNDVANLRSQVFKLDWHKIMVEELLFMEVVNGVVVMIFPKKLWFWCWKYFINSY